MLHPRTHVCSQCQKLLRHQRQIVSLSDSHLSSAAVVQRGIAPVKKSKICSPNGDFNSTGRLSQRPQRRFYRTTSINYYPSQPTVTSSEPGRGAPIASLDSLAIRNVPIREHLRQWQEQFGRPNEEDLAAFEKHPAREYVPNDNFAKLPGPEGRDNAEEDLEDDYNYGEDPELNTVTIFLTPGDVGELIMKSHEPTLAAFVQQIDRTAQFILPNGKWCHADLSSVQFAIPNCIDRKLIQPLIPYLPTKVNTNESDLHIPRELTRDVTSILQKMTNETEEIYRENSAILDNAHVILASENKARMMTLKQIAIVLLGQGDLKWTPSPSVLLAVRKALLHNRFNFQTDGRSSRATNVMTIRPKKEVDLIERVQAWMREYAEYRALSTSQNEWLEEPVRPSRGAENVVKFIEKARRIIMTSRKIRGYTEGGQLSSKPRSDSADKEPGIRLEYGEKFTESDQLLIKFLKAWVLSNQFKGVNSLWSQCTTLIGATGCYEEYDSLRSTGMLFLQEIGVILPWENRTLYDGRLMLPLTESYGTVEDMQRKAEALRSNPGFHDSMEDLRHDWGETNVYCIDDAEAKEIDDGLSITKVADRENEYWVHVHVANPTAFFDKTSPLASLAAHMTESFYFPERTFPMLPKWVTQDHFSLESNRPVLTFSIRLDTSGSILETKIQNGIIHKIVSLTPDELTHVLGFNRETKRTRIVVGGELPQAAQKPSHLRRSLSPSQTEELQDLCTIAFARRRAREEAGGLSLTGHSPTARVFEREGQSQSGLAWRPPSDQKARFVHGDPIIEYTAVPRETTFETGMDETKMVSEMMMLACEAAGRWLAERDIPAIFRGTIQPPGNDEMMSIAQFQKEILKPYMAEHGQMPYSLGSQFHGLLGRAIAHTKPVPHLIMGVNHYVKVTSPLRRFGDMISHWQIEAALRREAETGEKFGPKDLKTNVLPFSERQMQESVTTLVPRESLISKNKIGSVQFWTAQAILRAFMNKEAELPETWKVVVKGELAGRNSEVQAHVVDLDFNVFLKKEPGIEYEPGDEWEAKIKAVLPFSRNVVVEGVRLIQRNTFWKPKDGSEGRKGELESGGV
ncbi:RNB-domain-containing protein [Delitschia confertaspora ATCC 74209]|uniref:RNB-domain-containing protein n=1 Tax=Delitschia confertaspora ATCC 74209 TaxID=1513339 RepID=A0A9P4JKK0_9PLEO|nr:RNB-domain-containing protein [Delitschia confertaspora ATCC 74209]